MVIDASAVAIEVEFCGYTDKESHAGDLQQQSGFKKEFAKVLLRGADGAVKKLGDTDGCQGSNDSVKTNEGGNDAARVDQLITGAETPCHLEDGIISTN